MNPSSSFALRIALSTLLLGALVTAVPTHAADSVASTSSRNDSLKFELKRAIDKGTEYLINTQKKEGYWSTADHPALTGLPLVALQGDPSATDRKDRAEHLAKAYEFLLSCVHDDGIYGKRELINYNTSVSLLALSAAKNPKYDSAIRQARQNLIHLQYDGGEKGTSDTPFDGGIGYGSSSPKPDLVNTLHALEALYYSQKTTAEKPATADDLNWKAAIQFIENCQHLPKYNSQPWVSEDPANLGGFVYSPESSKAGEFETPNGRKALRAYGSISYAGMLSYIYAGLKPNDPRVTAVLDWARHNYTLDENPGMGAQGLYFYFHTMAKALSTANVETLTTVDGKNHNWRGELALRLLDLQKSDGSWSNDNGRWWEKDPALVTSYSLIALEMLYRGL
jgi:squalene-hopene/tetraprenyl-beta-curcumene cyclase